MNVDGGDDDGDDRDGDDDDDDDDDRRSMTMLFVSRSALAFPSPAVPVLAIVAVYTVFLRWFSDE